MPDTVEKPTREDFDTALRVLEWLRSSLHEHESLSRSFYGRGQACERVIRLLEQETPLAE